MKQLFSLFMSICCGLASICQAPPSAAKSKPLIIGEIDEIQSAILAEKRTLNIYLPDGYKINDDVKYPVVYLLDGGTDEDFIHITGLYQFNSFPWINRVQPSIIVGIANTNRMRDMTYPTANAAAKKKYPASGRSGMFIDFIEKELQPYVQKKFKTNSSKTIIGESLGGLLVTEILLKSPALFDKYIIVSPSLWWDNGSLLNQSTAILEDSLLPKTSIYIGVGKEGLTPGDVPRVMEVDANLLADKIKGIKRNNLTVYFDYLPSEDHATIMHQAVLNALRLLNPMAQALK
jgi:predicted alpha/beta superfamily hydrolase